MPGEAGSARDTPVRAAFYNAAARPSVPPPAWQNTPRAPDKNVINAQLEPLTSSSHILDHATVTYLPTLFVQECSLIVHCVTAHRGFVLYRNETMYTMAACVK